MTNCVFCEHCTDVFWDNTNLVYMIHCDEEHNPLDRPCEYFKERTMNKTEAAEILQRYVFDDEDCIEPDIKDFNDAFKMAIKTLQADAVEVVRCKDCRWFKQDSSPVGYGYCDGRMVGREVDYNDYCSYGERSEK